MAAALALAMACGVCPEPYVQVAVLSDTGVVCEDFTSYNGSITYFGGKYDGLKVPKRVYDQQRNGTWAGLNKTDVLASGTDLLAKELLKGGRDPLFDEVFNAIPPIVSGYGSKSNEGYLGQHTFVSSRSADLEAVFDHQGAVGKWAGYPTPRVVLGQEWPVGSTTIHEGLLGGTLMACQFVYTFNATVRWEMTAVPVDVKDSIEQPILFRFARILNNRTLDRAVTFNTYAYTPATPKTPPELFYTTLADHSKYWSDYWASENRMGIQIPIQALADQAVHSLTRDMVSRRGYWWPKYGVCGTPGGCSYGSPRNNGFQEIFTASVATAIEWGAFKYAKGVISNYFTHYVLPDGGLMYRGLEMAQESRMLTVLALYYRYTGDKSPIVDAVEKVLGVGSLLLKRLNASRELPATDPGYGMPIGNDEADLWTYEVGPEGGTGATEVAFYSIATEMLRGFKDVGPVLSEVFEEGTPAHDLGQTMLREAPILARDLNTSLSRSAAAAVPEGCHPFVATGKYCAALEHPHSFRENEQWRTYSEMFYSHVLPKSTVQAIYAFNVNNSQMTKLGIPTNSGPAGTIATFTAHGWGYGLLQNDMVPEFILQLYGLATHAYTTGTWTAFESTNINAPSQVPYCPPAQLVLPLNVKWMLLLDDPNTGVVWFGKGVPRDWLKPQQDGAGEAPKVVGLTNAPSRYGVTTFAYTLQASSVVFTATLNAPPAGYHVRLRVPAASPVKSVTSSTGPVTWDAATESVFLQPSPNTHVTVTFQL